MTYPDGSVYEGEFKQNKREGTGRYMYANGEVYEGSWKDDKKHGLGTYTYQNKSVLTGMWSRGNIMHAECRHLDGTLFSGRYSKSEPEGEGFFAFSNGLVAAGQFHAQTWAPVDFKRPGPKAKPPAPTAPTPFYAAQRLIKKSVFKMDMFESSGVVPAKRAFAGAPNFRQAGTLMNQQKGNQSQQDVPMSLIFSVAQPTLSGIRAIWKHMQNLFGANQVIWMSTREEVCAYAGEVPLHPRDRKALNEKLPVDVTKLSMEELAELDNIFALRIEADIQWRGGELQCFKETYAEDRNERKNIEVNIVAENQQVRSVEAVFEDFMNNDFNFLFHRVPLNASRFPTVAQIDAFISVLRDTGAGLEFPVVMCSRTGRLRSTIGMALATLYVAAANSQHNEGEEEEDALDDVDAEDVDGEGRAKREAKPEQDQSGPDYLKGEYAAVMKLVASIEGGEKLKKTFDRAIDEAGEIINLREAIYGYKTKYEQAPEELQEEIRREAVVALHRYMSLFVVYKYLCEQHATGFEQTYATWSLAAPQQPLFEQLGTPEEGPLVDFLWT